MIREKVRIMSSFIAKKHDINQVVNIVLLYSLYYESSCMKYY